jgi:hypothetical protein
MWSVAEFKAHLALEHAADGGAALWEQRVLPAIKHAVICASKCAQDGVKVSTSLMSHH